MPRLYGAMVYPLRFVLIFVCFSAGADINRPEIEQFVDDIVRQNLSRRADALNRAWVQGLPVRRYVGNGRVIELQYFDDAKPVYHITDNLSAADSISVDELWSGGSLGLLLNGSGETLGIWDEGSVRTTHQEFTGRATNIDGAGQSNHSTHVGGTMIAAGINGAAKGMSFAATLRSRDWNNDTGEMASDQLLIPPVAVSNHSYGFVAGWIFSIFGDGLWAWFGDVNQSTVEDAGFGYYAQSASNWDQIVFNSPNYIIVTSAGNDRNDPGPGSGTHWHFDSSMSGFVLSTDTHPPDGNFTGYDTIGAGTGSAKNIFTVAAVSDIPGGYQNPSDVIMSSFSGWGPTDDGRIKPDIAANGIGLVSSIGTHDAAYASFSGTSMAAPNAAGAFGLLTQHARDIYGDVLMASTMKALAFNTADEAGTAPGPDYRFGWGLLNAAAAAQLMTDDWLTTGPGNIFEIQLNNQATDTVEVESDGAKPLRATIAWTDPAASVPPGIVDPPNLMLVNDLDMRIIDPNGITLFPWVLDPANPANPAVVGDNFRDNVEQIDIPAPVAGTYYITISHKGALLGNTPQWVGLVVSGAIGQTTAVPPTITSTPSTSATVDTPYSYDANNVVEVGGTAPITFSLLSGPAGMVVSSSGLVSWTPGAGQVGNQVVQIQAQNAAGADVQSFTISVAAAPPPPPSTVPPTISSTPSTIATVDAAYSYDANNTVESGGTAPITFSLLSGPTGMVVNSGGLVSWTPVAGQEGNQSVQIRAQNAAGADIQSFTISVAAAPPPPAGTINFNDFTIAPYAGAGVQDVSGTAAIEDGGATLHMIGNLWKQITFPYTVTADTVLEFDFSSSAEGEIHGIGFDNDLVLSPDLAFQLFGTQLWGTQNFHTYTGGGGVQHYVIPVGQFYTGPMQYLFFALDHDRAIPNGDSRFSNVRIYEDSPIPVAPTITSTPSTGATLDTPYSYDADNSVEASGTAPISFSLLSGPTGMAVSSSGLVNWTPIAGHEGNLPVQIQAQNSAGSNIQNFTINVAAAPQPPPAGAINFNDHSIGSYAGAGAQDISGTVTVEDGGATLQMTGNLWKQITFPYMITPDTVLEFDFSSSAEGEIHGIGFDNDLVLSPEFTFQLYGTQLWGIQDFHTYTGSGGVQHYVIPVGQFYTGAMQYLFFALDHDVASPNGDSRFSNVQIHETSSVNFNNFTVAPYAGAGAQDISGTVTVEDGGATLQMTGNLWKQITFPYMITPATVLEFDFSSSAEGEIHGIGFDNDLVLSPEFTFQLYGTQLWGIQNFHSYTGSGGVQHYVIPVGQFYTGAMQYLFFALDHDVAGPNGDSRFSNVQIHEDSVINFNNVTIASYAGAGVQDVSGATTVEDGGATLHMTGNLWKQIAFPYTVTPATVIEFDFSSSAEGEIHGIGFDNDLVLSPGFTFQLYGTQIWGIQNFYTYTGSGGVQHYVIPVGQFYTGAMQYLFFALDHDVTGPNGDSRFSNVWIYEN